MTKLAVLFATAFALASPGMAHAASPNGNHTFMGTVDVKKNLPVWTTCNLTAVINVSSGIPRLQSAVLTGGGLCSGITFTGLPSSALDFAGYPPFVIVPNVTMNWPPIGAGLADSCFGNLIFLWDGTTVPRTITFQDPLSDLPDGSSPRCKVKGIITQTPGPSLNLP